MKNEFTKYDVNQFFEEFKELPNSFTIENVHQLINNPIAKATHKVNLSITNFKIILMTSVLFFEVLALLIWPSPKLSNSHKIHTHSIQAIDKFEESNPSIEKPLISDIAQKDNSFKSDKFSSSKTTNDQTAECEIDPRNISNGADSTSNTSAKVSLKNENGRQNEKLIDAEEFDISVPIIQLTKNEMENLGFEFYRDSVVFIFPDGCNKYISSLIVFDLIRDSLKLINEKYLTLSEYTKLSTQDNVDFNMFIEQTVTRTCGKISLRNESAIILRAYTMERKSKFGDHIWSFDEDKIDGEYPEMSKKDIDFNMLVPIQCFRPEGELLRSFYQQVFWIYPNKKLFNSLPKELSKQLKSECNLLTSKDASQENKESDCTYFEACRSTLKIDDLKIYPNPVSQDLSITFSLSESTNGSIQLVDISGKPIRTIFPKDLLNTGYNSFKVNLSDVPSGIYLVSIVTQRGFKTQRVIISH